MAKGLSESMGSLVRNWSPSHVVFRSQLSYTLLSVHGDAKSPSRQDDLYLLYYFIYHLSERTYRYSVVWNVQRSGELRK